MFGGRPALIATLKSVVKRRKRMRYDYVHLPEGEDIGPTGRAYGVFEGILTYEGRRVLFLDVEARGASFCDGSHAAHVGGINVKGYIMKWKYRKNERGEPISHIEPIERDTDRRELASIIEAKYGTSQITFS